MTTVATAPSTLSHERAAAAPPARSKALARLPVIVAALAGLLLSATAATLTWQWEKKRSHEEFVTVAQSHFLALQRGLDDYLNGLKALRALFEVSDNVTREQFDSFAGSILADQKAIQNFSWVPRVTGAERAAFEEAATRDGIPNYRIKAVTPGDRVIISPERDEYLPILYSTVPRTSRIYGIDLLSQASVQERLARARDTNTLSAVPDFLLHSSRNGDVRGFLFSLPVFRKGQPIGTVEERQRNLIGFTHGAFLTAEAIEHILNTTTTARGIDISVFLSDAGPDTMPLHVHSSRLRAFEAMALPLSIVQAGQNETSALSTGTTRWTLVATPAPGGPLAGQFDRSWLVLLAGLLVTAVAVQYTNASIGHAERLMQANEEISSLARRDPLTGLYNRRAFNESLATFFAGSRRNGVPFAVLYFDLDHFKEVNDTQGHPAGDLLLQHVAERVLGACRQIDVVARFGGDEFAILQTGADGAAAMLLAGRINEILDQPYQLDGKDARITASIGIAQFTRELESPDALILQADLALYRAKAEGRNCYRFQTAALENNARGGGSPDGDGRRGKPRIELVVGEGSKAAAAAAQFHGHDRRRSRARAARRPGRRDVTARAGAAARSHKRRRPRPAVR